jgi:hypothetical protein
MKETLREGGKSATTAFMTLGRKLRDHTGQEVTEIDFVVDVESAPYLFPNGQDVTISQFIVNNDVHP